MIFCNECIHFGVCMGFYKCKRFERRENANMRITGYESDNGKLTAVIVTDETRDMYDKRFVPERPHGKWTYVRDEKADLFLKDKWYCSACGDYNTYGEPDFCPGCGADMRASKKDERKKVRE